MTVLSKTARNEVLRIIKNWSVSEGLMMALTNKHELVIEVVEFAMALAKMNGVVNFMSHDRKGLVDNLWEEAVILGMDAPGMDYQFTKEEIETWVNSVSDEKFVSLCYEDTHEIMHRMWTAKTGGLSNYE